MSVPLGVFATGISFGAVVFAGALPELLELLAGCAVCMPETCGAPSPPLGDADVAGDVPAAAELAAGSASLLGSSPAVELPVVGPLAAEPDMLGAFGNAVS